MAAPETLTAAGSAPITPTGRSIIVRIAEMRAWLFLALLIILFEVWARVAYGVSFVFNTYNLQSIAVFATTPLLLALGQTFVIISAGIDLSLGFVMGLASVIAAHVANYAAAAARAAAFGGDAGRDSCWHLDDDHSRPGQRLADRAFEGAAIHRNARHVWRGARLGLSVRRRHDRLDQQPLVQHDRQRPRLRHPDTRDPGGDRLP